MRRLIPWVVVLIGLIIGTSIALAEPEAADVNAGAAILQPQTVTPSASGQAARASAKPRTFGWPLL